jgi:hypothetical protein
MFNFTFKQHIKDLLSPRYKKVLFWIEWIYALLKPAETLHTIFVAKRAEDIILLQYNAQTLILESLLQSEFDAGVYITNMKRTAPNGLYAWQSAKNTPPLYAYQANKRGWSLYAAGVTLNVFVDFIIYYPSTATIDLIRLNAIVKRYAHAGKVWQLIPY